MGQDLPTLPDLLRTVRAYIDDITPRVPDADRYHAMCCSYLLAVAEREVLAGPAAEGRMTQALDALRATTGLAVGDAEALASALRAGSLDAHWTAAFDTVLALVRARVDISKPGHLHPMHQETPA